AYQTCWPATSAGASPLPGRSGGVRAESRRDRQSGRLDENGGTKPDRPMSEETLAGGVVGPRAGEGGGRGSAVRHPPRCGEILGSELGDVEAAEGRKVVSAFRAIGRLHDGLAHPNHVGTSESLPLAGSAAGSDGTGTGALVAR